ncbi:hypothetical protein D3C73_1149780 [compost metagenome]
MATMRSNIGSIQIKRKEAVHCQLPPEIAIIRFRTKVLAKNSAASVPKKSAFFLFFFIVNWIGINKRSAMYT